MKKLNIIVLFLLLAGSEIAWSQADTLLIISDTIELAYNKSNSHRIVGAVDIIMGDELRHSPEYAVDAAIAGLAPGLYFNRYSGGPGRNYSSLKVRGLSRGNMGDEPLIVIDGIPNRNLADLSMESIESISILKDISAKMLYGSQAADGVILVTTREGRISDRKLLFSVESGIKTPTALPEYLDAATYAEKYNQARMNDGLDLLYTATEIESYRNQDNPLLYPDMDYYGTFLKGFSNFQRLNSSLTGGDERTKYYLNMEYVRETGLEAVGQTSGFNQINLVSNLNYKVNELISMSLGLKTRMGLYNGSPVLENEFFGSLSSHRPNDYPFFITPDQSVDTDLLAYNTVGPYNLYGQMTRSGYYNSQNYSAQSTLGLVFDLDPYVKGLSADMNLGFDTYNNIYTGKYLNYATYRIVSADSFVRIGEDEVKGTEDLFGDDFYRNVAGHASLNYKRVFGKHAITGNMVYSLRQLAYKSTETYLEGVRQDYKGINLGIRANYAYDDRYVIELNSSYMGSDKLESGNRFKPFGAAGAAWILSNESFMQNVGLVNYLKLKASFGVMGYDKVMSYYLYNDAFSGYGAAYFGVNNGGGVDYTARISKIGNPDITFEEAKEVNLGIEATILKGLSLEFNYFDEERSGIPTYLRSTLPGYVSSIAPIGNYNIISNTGFDMALSYSTNIADLNIQIGGNFIYSKSSYEQYDEINFYQHLNRAGKSTDVLFGLTAEALYESSEDIINHGVSSSYGPIMEGDIRYLDYTNDLGDNVIDEYDMSEIGHYFPRINYAMHLNLDYKGLEIYALGQGISDVDRITNNTYFFNYGERKYSTEILDEYYPRLTTATSGGHSYQNSTYWLVDGSFFKLRMLEISYLFAGKNSDNQRMSGLKVFIRGTDLFTITNFKKLDPEDMNAGVSKYPLFRTVSVGAKIDF